LIECEAVMARNDAIMEPSILDTLRRYVAAGGKPTEAIGFISENYRGYAQMASLVCGWLDHLEDDPSEKGQGEAKYLAELVKEKFDPRQADTVFSSKADDVPGWLKDIMQDRHGRSLLYELADQHRNCLLLSCAIQSIWKAGYESEVASRSVAAAYFEVLVQMLSQKLKAFVSTSDPLACTEIAIQLRNTVCSSQEAYVFTQLLLSGLEGEAHGGPACRRLMQELEQGAANHLSTTLVRKMAPLWAGNAHEAEAAAAVADLTSALAHNDLARVHGLYRSDAPPAVSHLRDPVLIEKLLAALFAPLGKAGQSGEGGALHQALLRPHSKQLALDLLAYAAAAPDSTSDALNAECVASTRAALEHAIVITQQPPAEMHVHMDLESPTIQSVLTTPVSAAGILLWLETKLSDPHHYTSAYSSTATPLYLEVLKIVGGAHPLLVPQVLEVLIGALECIGKQSPELQQHMLSIAALLLRHGHVEAVAAFADRWVTGRANPDPSLVRYLIVKIVGIAAPPFSRFFVVCVLRLLRVGGDPQDLTLSSRNHLCEFVEFSIGANFEPPLSKEEHALLQQMHSDLLM